MLIKVETSGETLLDKFVESLFTVIAGAVWLSKLCNLCQMMRMLCQYECARVFVFISPEFVRNSPSPHGGVLGSQRLEQIS